MPYRNGHSSPTNTGAINMIPVGRSMASRSALMPVRASSPRGLSGSGRRHSGITPAKNAVAAAISRPFGFTAAMKCMAVGVTDTRTPVSMSRCRVCRTIATTAPASRAAARAALMSRASRTPGQPGHSFNGRPTSA